MTTHDHTRRSAPRRGFTLVETMVVVALIAIVAGMSVYAMGGIGTSRVQAEAMRLSGALRMAYGRAAINGLRYSVVFDLDAGTYSVQCASENVLLPADGEDREEPDGDDDEADPFGLGPQNATMDDCSEDALPSVTVRSRVKIARILTSHDSDPVESGQNSISIFPNGYVERSVIWLSDDDGKVFITLTLDPMTGRVRAYPEDLEIPDDFFEIEEED